MRTLVAGKPRSSVWREEVPGIVGKRRSGVAAVTTALALFLGAPALVQADAPVPERVSGGTSQQSGPVTERTYSDAPASAASEPADSGPAVAPATAVAPAVSSDDGLGTLVIVLISVGGVMALGAAAYTARRVMHHGHGHAAS